MQSFISQISKTRYFSVSLKFNLFSIKVQQLKNNFHKQTVNREGFRASRLSLGTLLGGENEVPGPVSTEEPYF